MQLANVMVALGGDTGQTVPKYNVTPAEIAVLRAIHGDDAVFDIEYTGEISIPNRVERQRLIDLYGHAKDHENASIVAGLFPGAAARVFESLDELDLPEVFVKTAAPAEPVAPADGAPKTKGKKAAKADPVLTDPALTDPALTDEDDGIDDMPAVLG